VPISGGTSAWSREHPFFRYGVAVLAAVTATALKVALAAYVVPTFILAYPAVLVAAAFGGMGPGILASVVSAAMAWYWVLPSPGDFHALSVQEAWALSLFLLMGVPVSLGAERMRRSQRRADALEMLGHDLASREAKRTADLFHGEELGEGGPVEHDRRLRKADGTFIKKIRNDQGDLDRIESYISTRTDATFSHGICGDCSRAWHPTLTRSGDTPGK
jgi:hypothetical protein